RRVPGVRAGRRRDGVAAGARPGGVARPAGPGRHAGGRAPSRRRLTAYCLRVALAPGPTAPDRLTVGPRRRAAPGRRPCAMFQSIGSPAWLVRPLPRPTRSVPLGGNRTTPSAPQTTGGHDADEGASMSNTKQAQRRGMPVRPRNPARVAIAVLLV